MELSVESLLISLLTILLVWIWGHSTSKGRLPPGPRPLPLLGNILQINPKGFLKSFQEVRWGGREAGGTEVGSLGSDSV